MEEGVAHTGNFDKMASNEKQPKSVGFPKTIDIMLYLSISMVNADQLFEAGHDKDTAANRVRIAHAGSVCT